MNALLDGPQGLVLLGVCAAILFFLGYRSYFMAAVVAVASLFSGAELAFVTGKLPIILESLPQTWWKLAPVVAIPFLGAFTGSMVRRRWPPDPLDLRNPWEAPTPPPEQPKSEL